MTHPTSDGEKLREVLLRAQRPAKEPTTLGHMLRAYAVVTASSLLLATVVVVVSKWTQFLWKVL